MNTIEKSAWTFCEDNHEYSEYRSALLNQTVCFTCDPESKNNRHRPAAQAVIAEYLNDHPVHFLDKDGFIIPFKSASPDDEYTCPHCGGEVRWYQAGPESVRWACDCE